MSIFNNDRVGSRPQMSWALPIAAVVAIFVMFWAFNGNRMATGPETGAPESSPVTGTPTPVR